VDIAKLRDYCLSPNHPRGRHKARVFASLLGLRADDAEFLRQSLLDAARQKDATAGQKDEYGERYAIDFQLSVGDRHAQLRSAWIVRKGESFPRFTTCYVILD
jgi:hypothetical protein